MLLCFVKKIKICLFNLGVCVCASMNLCACRCLQKEEEVRSTGARVRDEYEMPDVDARNQTPVLYKSSMCS